MRWKKYLINSLIKDKDKVIRLLDIDENYSYELLLKLANKDFNLNIHKYATVLLESNPVILINLIDHLMKYNRNIIICTMDNYSINSYIISKYKDFLIENFIDSELQINISKHFRIEDNNIISIGSEAFNNEMKSIYKNINSIVFEI